MYLIEPEKELSLSDITEIIREFQSKDLPKMNRYKNYYLGKQDILLKQMPEGKPNNRIVVNYCHNIVENYLGYLTGKDITYHSLNDISNIQDILNYNDVSQEDNSLLRDALIYGRGCEIMYIDADKKQRFKTLDPRECIPIYWATLDKDLACVIRFYKVSLLDRRNDDYYIECYEPNRTRIWKSNISESAGELISDVPNYYEQVPINILSLNEEESSIFDKVITLQDCYNTLISSETDDFEAFCDAYLVLKNMEVEPEELAKMRENRALILPADGSAEYLTKNISDTQIENMLKNVKELIHKISASPDFTDDAFGTASGISMKYKLQGFMNIAGSIEKNMTKTLQRRIELICTILNLVGEEAWRDVEITFNENLPIDLADIANSVNTLRGLVSTKTLLAQIPFINNVDDELAELEKENESTLSLYNFGGNNVLDEATTEGN